MRSEMQLPRLIPPIITTHSQYEYVYVTLASRYICVWVCSELRRNSYAVFMQMPNFTHRSKEPRSTHSHYTEVRAGGQSAWTIYVYMHIYMHACMHALAYDCMPIETCTCSWNMQQLDTLRCIWHMDAECRGLPEMPKSRLRVDYGAPKARAARVTGP